MMKLVACVALICSFIIGTCAVDYSARTLAGSFGQSGTNNGLGSAARFNQPSSAFYYDHQVYVADTMSSTIRTIDDNGNTLTKAGLANTPGLVNGTDNLLGSGTARFNNSCGIAVDSKGVIYIVDTGNHVIRMITTTGTVSTFAGNGTAGHADGAAASAMFRFPTQLVINPSTGDLYVSDSGNHVIRKISSGTVSTFAGNATQAALNPAGAAGFVDGTGANCKFNNPTGIAIDSDSQLYVADTNNNVIRSIKSSGEVATFAGNGTAGFLNEAVKKAMFNGPQGVAVDGGKNVYVADTNNHMFRQIAFAGQVLTLSGKAGQAGAVDGDVNTARYNLPKSIMLKDSTFYVADTNNNVIRLLTATTKPSVVNNVTVVTSTSTSITLSWKAPPSDGGSAVLQYTIQYSPVLSGVISYITVPSGTTYTFTGLLPITQYQFQVAASNYIGRGDWSSQVTTTTPAGAPIAPTALVVSSDQAPSSTSAVVSWTAPTNNGGSPITGYIVTYINTVSQVSSTVNTNATTVTATATGLTAFQTYSVSVQATNSAGPSPASSSVSLRLQHKSFTFFPALGACNATAYAPLATASYMHASCGATKCALIDPTSLNSTLYSQECLNSVPKPLNNTNNVQLTYYQNNACSGVAYSAFYSYKQAGACVPNNINGKGGYMYVTCAYASFCTDSNCQSCIPGASAWPSSTCNTMDGGKTSYSLYCGYKSASVAVAPSVIATLALVLLSVLLF